MSLVSVIIPVYNCEAYLDKCLQSVVTQSYKNIEIIIVNDGSTDSSSDIIRRYADSYSNVLSVEQANMGVSEARNRGIDRAQGEFILFLDGDDYIGADYVSSLVEAAENYACDLVICGCTMVDTAGREIQRIVPDGYERGTREEWAYRLSSVCSHLYRRKAWMDAGIQFAIGVRGEDLPIALFFNYTCRNILAIPEASYYYVQHSDSAMGSSRGLQNFKLPIEAICEILEKLQSISIEEYNSHEFLEYGVLKALAMFLFDLGRGASWPTIKELCQDSEDIIHKFFPEYKKNQKCRWNSHIRMPFAVKGAVWLLVRLLQLHMLKPFMWIYCKLT